MPEPVVLKWAQPSDYIVNARAILNLSKIARACIELNATEAERAVPVNVLSVATGMDRSNIAKAITDRPGFVKCLTEINGTRGLRYYYLPEFYEHSKLLNPTGALYYPPNVAGLVGHEKHPLEVLFSDGRVTIPVRQLEPTIHASSDRPRREPVVVECLDFREDPASVIRQWPRLHAGMGHLFGGIKRSGSLSLSDLDALIAALVTIRQALWDNMGNVDMMAQLRKEANEDGALPGAQN